MEETRAPVGASSDAVTSQMKGLGFGLAAILSLSFNYVTAKYALQGFNAETFSMVPSTMTAGPGGSGSVTATRT